MKIKNKSISWIEGTPLGLNIYSVERLSTQLHGEGLLEIIFCLQGNIKFSYSYEEFTLHQGEFISVDKDAYFLYDGQDAVCVSFYLNLSAYEHIYPFIKTTLFVCEGLESASAAYHPTGNHNRLKGMLVSLLKYVSEHDRYHEEYLRTVNRIADHIVELFVNHFDIIFYYSKAFELKPDTLDRYRKIQNYMHRNLKKQLTMKEMAREFNLSEGYLSEYLRKIALGFRTMVAYNRANESEKYLLTTDSTIVEISELCGFSDVKYYYSAFKKWYKCTPKQFREKYGKNQDGADKILYLDTGDIRGILNHILIEHYMHLFFD